MGFWGFGVALQADEPERTSRWIACRRWMHIILLGAIAAWWALSDSQRGSAPIPRLAFRLSWIDPALVKPLLFWGPIGGVAVVHIICYSLDRTFLGRRWSVIDVLRLACWRTLCPTVALLFVATGFEAIYDRRLTGILWLVVAAILAMVGIIRLNLAEGMKLQRVKYRRTVQEGVSYCERRCSTTLKRVYVVPAGRGHLTNAYGPPAKQSP